ncbi:MAG TPA: hypothetical protein VLN08_15460, partial [Vicinamibacterales bacterium]|nr:hypothetical protein [Vicinamibacterales bacterium]
LPPVQIPVEVQHTIDLPAVTRGPVRIDGARLPLTVSVSQIVAARGTLWIALSVEPGAIVKTADAPAAGESTAEEVGVSLDEDVPAKAPAKAPGKKR